nr:TIM barrel protein [Pseudoalteromonas sp. WY3]
MPAGDWDAGERGFAAIPGREQEFKQSVAIALDYAAALNCKKVHAMAGIVKRSFSREQHVDTFIKNIRYAADTFAKHDIELMIEPLNNRDVPHYLLLTNEKLLS